MSGNKKRVRLLLAALAAAAGAFILGYCLWHGGAFLPRWIVWESGETEDASGVYRILLKNKSVQVRKREESIWSSPEDIKVQEALSCDIDLDGQDELVLLCWKVGRYGAHRPFWVEQDEKSWSQHIFVYEYGQEEMRPKWMSSYIGQDVVRLAENGKSAPYTRLWLTDRKGEVSSWKWDSWGFSKEDTAVSFTVFGDLIAHEPIYRYGLSGERGFDFLFENVAELLEDSDVRVIGQETPLTEDPLQYGDYPRFGTPAGVGQAIADAGFDAVNCASNHALDRGAEGAAFTKRFFEERNILCLGIREESEADAQGENARKGSEADVQGENAREESEEDAPDYEILTRKGVRFALFNYTYGTNGISLPEEAPVRVLALQEEERIREQLEAAGKEADIVIVFAHWGTENSEEPDAFQKKWAQIFLEEGVDAVVGAHPHALQPVEMLEGEDGHRMLLYYSIGNFVSAQPEKRCVKGGAARFTVSLTEDGYRVTEYELVPLEIVWQEDGKVTVWPAAAP